MTETPFVSILINNYNYAAFLKEALDSALEQTYCNVEVIVVDDGSTDGSEQVIAGYGDRVLPVMKENGGQASAYNAGFAASRGEIICLMDSDDLFLAHKVETVVDIFRANPTAGWCFDFVQEFHDASGAVSLKPPSQLSGKVDARAMTAMGKQPFLSTASSGLSFRRALLTLILPMPEVIRITSDNYIKNLSLGLAEGWLASEMLTLQRIHGNNAYTKRHDGKDRLVGRTELLTGASLHQKSPDFETLGKNIFCRGLGKLWATGGVDHDCKELAGSLIRTLSIWRKAELFLRTVFWTANHKLGRLARLQTLRAESRRHHSLPSQSDARLSGEQG